MFVCLLFTFVYLCILARPRIYLFIHAFRTPPLVGSLFPFGETAVPKSAVDKTMVPEEQTMLLESSEGVVGHTVWPPSPMVVPPAMEEDEVEEIEHEES